MADLLQPVVWFITGSQHLYGPEALEQVAKDSQALVKALDAEDKLSVPVIFKPILTTPEQVTALMREANSDANCIGLITWMHTFSPAKMWIAGLSELRKPIAHLHTQFNRDIPWPTIDMDFMNLNQSAHGGREYGFMLSRLRQRRKVIVGHWQDPTVIGRLDTWMRAAHTWADQQQLKIARIGDNMRQVAVTEGDKVEAQMTFGYQVNGYGLGDLVEHQNQITDKQIDQLCTEYEARYEVADVLKNSGERHEALRDAARIELALRSFLDEGGFKGFTDTFENLHGLKQLPGIATQRLMADGYGFGAEGDWKTAALLRAMKVMDQGLEGGTSFMEDYTYHFAPDHHAVLGAHMLEICPSIASQTPTCEIHPLGIGGKEDPVRLVFTAPPGPALNASIVDMGERFRLIVNEVNTVTPEQDLPNLPVARALWHCKPNLTVAAECWIHAGGAHHTGFSQSLTTEHLEDFANMADVELLVIDDQTRSREFQNALMWNDAAYRLKR